jgi:nitric oxide reductase large subunit
MFVKYGPFMTGFITVIMLYLFSLLIYTHYKIQSTSPGYPERVATATGHLKLNFEKS